MSGHHEACGPQEVFLGNTGRHSGRFEELRRKGLKTIRMGNQALDIEGKKLPNYYAPLFLSRSEENKYDAIMIEGKR